MDESDLSGKLLKHFKYINIKNKHIHIKMYRKPPKVNYEEKDTSRSITSLYLNNFSGKEKPRNQMTSRKSLTKR